MNVVTLPLASVPIGSVQGTDVIVNPQWMRAFFDLLNRTGGVSANSSSDIQSNIATEVDALSQQPKYLPDVSIDSLAAEVSRVQDLLSEFAKELDALKQGVQL